MPQRDNTIEELKRLDALLEYALGRGDLPSGIFDARWNRLRVTGRGGVSGASVSMRAGGAGFVIRIR